MNDLKYVAVVLDLEGKMISQAIIETQAAAIRGIFRGLISLIHLIPATAAI